MVGLSTWLLLVVLLPRVAADWSAKQHPLPTRVMFNRQLAEDRKKGINGHDPQDERARRFEDSLLKVYKVDSLSQLPVNADGLIMQADEVYSNQVYDQHFNRVRQTLLQQISWARWFGVVSPAISAQQLSMGLAGTDVHAYLQFTRTAEDYRRYLIEELNLKMAYGGSKTGDWDWTVDASYFKDLRDYSYTPLTLKGIWRAYQRDVFLLVGWLVILFAALVWSGKRMPLV
jgi:ABC-2 type transport system permease protein